MVGIRFFALLVSFSLLVAPLPLPIIAQTIINNMPETVYVDLSEEGSNIAHIIEQLSELDENNNSLLHQLNTRIKRGFTFAHYNVVREALEYAQIVINKHYKHLCNKTALQTIADLDALIDDIGNDLLMQKPTNTISANINALRKLFFAKHIKAKRGVNGSLNLLSDNEIRLQDLAGMEYVGINAPPVMSSSYTVSLPTTAPLAHQLLQANSITPTNLEWVTTGGSITPADSKTIYVAEYGDDVTGDGSFNTPYASLLKAIAIANGIASLINPICIFVAAGIYTEDNSVGPLTITANGISIVGSSPNSTIITPSTPANDLLAINNTIRIADLTVQSSSPLATGISLTTGNLSVITNARIVNFQVGISCSGGTSQLYGFNNCIFIANSTGLSINDCRVAILESLFFGVSTITNPAANTGIIITGAGANMLLSGGSCGKCDTGFNITGNSTATITGMSFKFNTFDIIQSGASHMVLSSSSFELTDSNSDISIQISDAGTSAEIIGCQFNGNNILGVPQGICLAVSGNAEVNISSGSIKNYSTALHVGISVDSSSTIMSASNLTIVNCATDILQEGLSSLNFNSSIASSSKISINDSTNITLAYFDLENNNALTIGSFSDKNTSLLQASIATTNHPAINYKSSLYSTQAIGFENELLNPSTSFMISQDNATLTAITTNRVDSAGIRLVSDEGSPVGGTTALRGWDINKNGSSAELSFNYQNSDVVGQTVIPQYTVIQFDGVNNQVQLPTAGTQIIFDGDTNLYRSSANVLKTDDNFIVGTLTPGTVVITDPITNQLNSSVVTNTELSYVSGVTSSIQTQLNSKVAKSGDTMTGTLILPAGSAASPILKFTGSTNTGLSAATANVLSFDINGVEQMNLSSSGLTIDGFATAGIVHNSAAGLLTSSLIVNADVDPAAGIVDTKLATISTAGKVANSATTATAANTASAIVARDSLGNFAAGTITANLTGNVTGNVTGSASNNVLKAGDTMTGTLQLPAGTTAAPSLIFTGSTTTGLSANSGDLSLSTNGVEQLKISSGGIISIDGFTTAGVVHNDASGNLSSSLIVNADVSTSAAIVDTKLATISTAGKVANSATTATATDTANAIVARDSLGNFSAGTITANLTGNVTGNVTGSASNNVLKAGDTMTGTLILPAGSATVPSLEFTGSTNTGLSAATANTLSFDVNGVEQMNLSSSGLTIDGFITAGVVHNNASGLLSSSLIVNADVDPAAAIVDTKLATISTAGKVANSATTAVSANTANAIVARDSLGNFSASTITANLTGNVTGSASNNVLKAGDTMTGTLILPAGNTASPALKFTGSTNTGLSAGTANILSFDINGVEQMNLSSSGLTIDGFTTAGVVHNDGTGLLSSSLIVNADVDPAAGIVDTKLATISTAGKVANSATTATALNTASTIVARDSAGNFSAGTISANLTGNVTGSASNNVLKAGDTMTGTLQLPAGTAAAPSLIFTGSTTTGLSAATANTLSFDVNGVEQMNLSSSGLTIDGFTTAGIVHNDASGLLSSSLIVNADITDATISNAKLATISSANMSGNIVVRDGSGNFATNMITLIGTTTNSTDAATKAYVDAAVSTGIQAKTPAVVVSLTNQTLTGFPTIDGVTFPSGTNRILLTGQTNPVENGLWVAAAGAWTRPTDFASGTTAGQAYVLILSGATEEGSAWLCNTPNAIIDTDSIGFSLFSLPDTTTGANVGSGTGLIFRNKTGNSINFKSLIQGSHIVITNNADDITLATDATNNNIVSTIVARDSSGNFAAGTITANLTGNVVGNVTGSASNNVLKAGDTMTGTLILPTGSAATPSLGFTGSTTTGLSAATANTLSFDINGVEQMILSSSGLSIDAFTTAGVVHNDGTGLLSSSLIVNADVDPAAAITDSKLATISTAGKVANSATTATALNTANAIVARDSSGNFAAGTIAANLTGNVVGNVTGSASNNVLKAGDTMTGTLILPTGSAATPSLGFTGSTTTGLSAATANILSFDINGVEQMNLSSSGLAIDGFTVAGIVHNNAAGLLSSSLIVNADIDPAAAITDSKLATISTAGKVANSATTATALNTASAIVARDGAGNFSAGIITANLTGSASNNVLKSGDTMIGTLILPAGNAALPALKFTGSTNTGLSAATANTLSFDINGVEQMNLSSSGLTIDGFTTAGVVHNDGTGLLSSSLIVNADVDPAAGIVDTKLATISTAGKVSNSATTATALNTASAIVARDSAGNFAAGTITASLTGSASNNVLKAGDTMTGTLILPAGTAAVPSLEFTGSTNTGLSAATTNTLSFDINGVEQMNLSSSGLTIDGFTTAGVVHNDSSGLLSSSLIVNADVSASAGIVDTKLATISTAGKVANSATTATDANTASAIVARDSAGNFSASTITANLTGSASNNVLKAGDTMTGTLILPAGNAATPALKFTGSTNTGLSAATANTLSFDINGVEQMHLSSSGLAIDGFTTVGIVHNDATGLLSSSLIVNADVSASASIVDTKLATISTAGKVANSATTATNANTASTIVARDASGNFSAGTISANLVGNVTGSASNNVLKTGDTMTGALQLPAGSAAAPSLIFTGSTTTGLSANAGALSLSTNGTEQFKISSGGVISVDGFTVAGVVHNDSSGNLSSSLIVNADVAAGAGIIDTKLATISTAGKVANSATTATNANIANAIVARDSSGNFAAGTITANLTGSASNNVLKAGDTMTGTLILPAGSAAAPALKFTGSTNTGFSAATANTLSFDINGVEQMNLSSSGLTINGFTAVGVVHNDATGLLSSSLIVNADVDPAAGIVDTKLATISTAGKVANSATTATALNTASAIVARDASGNFSAGTISANLVGNVTGSASNNVLKAGDTMTGTLQLPAGTTAAPSLIFTGSTTAGLSANAGALSLSTNAIERMKISSGGTISIDAFTAAGIVHNDSSGNLSSSLIVNADVDPAAAIVDSKLATISTAGKVANSATTATNLNTANAIVARDASGNFSAGTITASLSGNATTATTATNFSGSLSGDVTGTQNATVVSTVGGQTAANVAAATVLANAATSANTANAIVKRDASGNFSAATISMTDGVLSGNLNLTTDPSTSTAGNILKNGTRFIHDFGTNNIFVGLNAGNFTLTGITNTALGANTLSATTIGTQNVAIGFNALNADIDGSMNIAIGLRALQLNTSGSANTAIGTTAMLNNTTGGTNTAIGQGTLNANITGSSNVALGHQALKNHLVDFTIAIGVNALSTNTTGIGNTAIGHFSLAANTIGTNNTALGQFTLENNTTGINNTAIGQNALVNNITGTNNTALGYNALNAVGSGSNNTAIGASALATNTTGTSNNTAIGSSALTANTTGTQNVAVGTFTLAANTIGVQNTAVGHNVLNANTGDANTAFGSQALALNTTGRINTAIGQSSLSHNITGSNNTALGQGALAAHLVDNTVAAGVNALSANTTGTGNTAVGYFSLATNTIGTSNTALGQFTLANNTTGINNTAIGTNGLQNNITGSNNTAIGSGALSSVTNGATNIAIGSSAGGTLTTGSGNIYINANAAAAAEANTIRIGTSQTACFIQGINGVNQGGSNVLAVFSNSNGQLGTSASSIRYKHNVQDMENASADILKLRPVTFVYNNDETESTQYGLIAEEVHEVFPDIVVRNQDGQIDAVQYHVLPVLLLNEIKKQQITIEQLKNDNNKRDALIQSLMKRLELLEARM